MPATTRFSLDGGYVPLSQEIGGFVAGDRAEAGILITGFDPATDVLDQIVFTAKVNPADADNAPTSVQKVLLPGNPANGTITTYDNGTTVLAAFDLLPADTLVLLSLHSYDVRVWVTRSGSTYDRTVQIGRTVAIQGITTQTQFTYPTVEWASIQHTPTTVAGYGITDAYTKTQADARYMALAGGDGSGITNLSATQLSTGIVPAARLVGAYSGITGVGTLASLNVSGSITGGSFVGNLTGNVTGTILTAAQPNITSLGVLTALDVSGTFTTTAIATSSFTASASSLGSASATSLSVSGAASVGTLSVSGPFAVGEGMTVTAQAQDSWALVLEAFSASVAGSVSIQFHSQAGRSLGSSIVGDKTATGGLIFNVNNGATQALALAASGVATFAVGATFGGALDGISTVSTSGAINGQTISATASFTGTVSIATGLTVVLGGASITGNSTITGTLGGLTTVTATSFVGNLTGNVSGVVTGSLVGNASSATILATARAINGVNFDGSAPITVTAAAGTLSGTTLNASVVTSSLTSVGTLATLTVTAAIVGSITGSSSSTTGNAATATALQTGRAINGVTFDGTAPITIAAAAGTLTGTTLAATVVTTSITSTGTITSGTWQGGAIAPAYGGTGVNNGASTITLGGALSFVGAFATAITVTAGTAVTLPTSGTLVNTAVTTLSSLASIGTITTGVWTGSSIATTYTDAKVVSISGTADKITIGGTATVPTVTIASTYAGQTSIITLGTVTTGTWTGTAIANAYIATGLDATKLTVGATLPGNVLASSLTSVGTLAALTVTATIAGSINGNAATATNVAASGITGTTLPAGIVTSSLTTVGALNAGSITSGFGSIDVGGDPITGGVISGISGAFGGQAILTGNILRVAGASAANGSYQLLEVSSTTAYGIDKGAGVTFGGRYENTNTAYAVFGSIEARKENATDGNYAGYLTVSVNSQATGNREIARFSSNGIFSTQFDATLNGVEVGRGGGSLVSNTKVGLAALQLNATGISNVAMGNGALQSSTAGSYNVALGANAGRDQQGTSNISIGYAANYLNTSGSNNVAIGHVTLNANTSGSGSVAIGHTAGMYETAGNSFYIDNQDRTNLANGRARALLYGTFNATATSQTLAINVGTLTTLGSLQIAGALTGVSTLTAATSVTTTAGTDAIYIGAGRTGNNYRSNLYIIGTDASGTPRAWNVGMNIATTDAAFEITNGAGANFVKIAQIGGSAIFAALVTAGSFRSGITNVIGWTGQGGFESISDGVFSLLNEARTVGGSLTLGTLTVTKDSASQSVSSIRNAHAADGFGLEIYAGTASTSSNYILALYDGSNNEKFQFRSNGTTKWTGYATGGANKTLQVTSTGEVVAV